MTEKSTFPLPGEVADEICRYSLKWHLENMKQECSDHESGMKYMHYEDYNRNKELIPNFEKVLSYYSL